MTSSVLEIGDKLHIMTRRLFAEDIRRHFAGEITAVSELLIEMHGYTFIFNTSVNEYRRLPETRTRIFSLGNAGHIINKVPRDVDLDALSYQIVEQRLVVTDKRSFSLAVNEFGPKN